MKTSALGKMYWLVKREFWEHKGGFFWAPVITSGIMLVLHVMSIIAAEVLLGHHGTYIQYNGTNLDHMLANASRGDLAKVGMALDVTMYSNTAIVSMVLGFVVFFYCLGALYDDRRDRSILFWKSLPLSDTSTVLSKVISAAVVAPAICFVVGVLSGMATLMMYTVVLALHGVDVWPLLTLSHPFRITANLLLSIPLYLLWSLPTIGWLMLCSAWARSKPFLWAVLLPLATWAVLGWLQLMGYRLVSMEDFGYLIARAELGVFPGGWLMSNHQQIADSLNAASQGNPLYALNFMHAWQAVLSADLWIGVACGALMLAAAIWFRCWRSEI